MEADREGHGSKPRAASGRVQTESNVAWHGLEGHQVGHSLFALEPLTESRSSLGYAHPVFSWGLGQKL